MRDPIEITFFSETFKNLIRLILERMASGPEACHSAGRLTSALEGERSATWAVLMLTPLLTRPACGSGIESDFEPDYGSSDSDAGKQDSPEVI